VFPSGQPEQNRREVLKTVTGLMAGLAVAEYQPNTVLAASTEQQFMMLGFSTYGMKSLKTEEAIRLISQIGFDSIEITVWPDWDAAPANMPSARRQAIRQQLADSGLVLTSLMEHITPSADDVEHRQHLARLDQVFELAKDLCPASPPLVQTVLGGGEWEQKRELLRDRVGDWLELAAKHQVVLAIKPHRGGVMSTPQEAVWLIEQLGQSQCLRIVYDYSHYAFRDMTLEDTANTALPYLAHVAVKDPVRAGDRVIFKLPGEAGTVPFAKLLKLLHAGGYRGDISCEVSGMVWNQPDYNPTAAAETCYAAMAAAFEEAGVPRPSRSR
jgi:sugar phosphate isomerase/epimerase